MKRFGETRDRKPGDHKITTRRAAPITSYPGQIGDVGQLDHGGPRNHSVTAPLRDGEETKRSNGYQRAFLAFSTRPLKPCYCATKNRYPAPSSRRPCLALHRRALPVQLPPTTGIVSDCLRDDLGVAKAYVTVKRITPFRSIPAVPQRRTRESIPGAWFGAAGKRIS
jgi:hypothetical protein